MTRSTLKNLILTTAVVLLAAGISMAGDNCPYSADKAKTAATTIAAPAVAKAPGETAMLKVSGMTCGSCVSHVTKALSAIEGVNDVTVSLEKGSAEVIYDAAKVKPAMLAEAVTKAGYKAEVGDITQASAKAAGCDPAECAAMKDGKQGGCCAKKAEATTGDGGKK